MFVLVELYSLINTREKILFVLVELYSLINTREDSVYSSGTL